MNKAADLHEICGTIPLTPRVQVVGQNRNEEQTMTAAR